MSEGPTRVERFLTHLDALSSGVEPEFWPGAPSTPGATRVSAIAYRDLPEPGLLLGVTYGLSLAHHDDWRYGRPELSICVESANIEWLLTIRQLAEGLQGDCAFTYADTISLGEPIASDTAMDGFVVFAPSFVDKADARIDVGDDLPIDIVGLYPTYESERSFIREHGLDAFWKLDWDLYDVSRPPAA